MLRALVRVDCRTAAARVRKSRGKPELMVASLEQFTPEAAKLLPLEMRPDEQESPRPEADSLRRRVFVRYPTIGQREAESPERELEVPPSCRRRCCVVASQATRSRYRPKLTWLGLQTPVFCLRRILRRQQTVEKANARFDRRS